jgi:hypothetical protein
MGLRPESKISLLESSSPRLIWIFPLSKTMHRVPGRSDAAAAVIAVGVLSVLWSLRNQWMPVIPAVANHVTKVKSVHG